jgi:DNA-binding MarR family transcriptional regulator
MGDNNWLESDEQVAWKAFVAANARLLTELDRELTENHAMTLAEYEVLQHLSEAPGQRLRMNELAEYCGLSPSGLTRRFDTMTRAGLVDRERCDDDRRGVHAVLTDLGFERLREVAPTHVDGVRRLFFGPLTDDEVAVLTGAFQRIASDQSDDVSVS